MNPKTIRFSIAGIFLTLLLGLPCYAKWARPDLNAPVDRLIANMEAYIQKNPKDAQGYYTLGRLHSLAYAKGVVEVSLYSDGEDKENRPPRFPTFDSILVKRDDGKPVQLTAEAFKHFHQSVRNYRRTLELKPDPVPEDDNPQALTLLGLGWMLEQGHLLGKKAGAPPGANSQGKPTWREQALKAYRTAFRLKSEEDQKREHLGLEADTITLEAVAGIERLQKGRNLNAAEKAELKKMQTTAAKIRVKPRVVTPIIFPLEGSASLRSMLSERKVTFDLAGDDIKRRWEWVRPDVGILVWDPEKKGRITSGRQLFGSVTWWMFWKDGYEPLAALDDNQDDGLTGKELEGIAVWRDANSNGVSDPGEVVPARKFGITRIETQAESRQEGALSHLQGIRLRNGATLPTFDWIPTGKPF